MKKTIPVLCLLLLGVLIYLWLGRAQHESQPAGPDKANRIAEAVAALWQGKTADIDGLTDAEVVYLAARRRGQRLAHGWAEGEQALAEVVQQVRSASGDDAANVDVLELVLARDFREQPLNSQRWRSNIYRGVYGLELRHGDRVARYSPTYMLATNRKPQRVLEVFRLRNQLPADAPVMVRNFRAEQWLVQLGDTPNALRMERGNQYVPVAQVTQQSTTELARLATDWMANNLHANGRMTYKYWPSVRSESSANNMIRQWMATIALIRAAKHWGDEALMARAADNIDYNLGRFYREENGYGLIEWQNKVKLGAVALAALALVEHPQSQRWAAQEAALRRTTDQLWHEDGSFTTFYKPAGRNDIQNFYPGEALLYWAALYERDREPERLARILKSFAYYRDWHLNKANRNPAFIPWHTQAYYKVWQLTGNEQLRDFIFTMNDWLVAEMLQEREDVRYRDTIGRYYNPNRPYGPPHVSSTGVYLEGLIDAFALAQQLQEEQRMERYRHAIRLGLRSVMQLQFVDEVDMFYIPQPLHKRVRGGLRTTVYNNEIRCDNVQHNLMGVIKILQTFAERDFRHR